MESTLRGVCEWAEKVRLSINADKTDLILDIHAQLTAGKAAQRLVDDAKFRA